MGCNEARNHDRGSWNARAVVALLSSSSAPKRTGPDAWPRKERWHQLGGLVLQRIVQHEEPEPDQDKGGPTMDQVIYEITPQRPSAAERYQATHPELDLLRHSKLDPCRAGTFAMVVSF